MVTVLVANSVLKKNMDDVTLDQARGGASSKSPEPISGEKEGGVYIERNSPSEINNEL